MRTPDEWAEVKREQLHRKNAVTPSRSVIDVRMYGSRLQFTEWAVFENGHRIKDGFRSREAAVEWALHEKAPSGVPEA